MKITPDLKKLIEDNISELDIYKYYMPWDFTLGKNCNNPFVAKDENPSMRIRFKDGKITHKCYNSNNSGDCYSLVMDMFGLKFNEALSKITKDFGLLEGKDNSKRVIKTNIVSNKVDNTTKIIAIEKDFTKYHEEYLKQYHLTLDDLKIYTDTKILALDKYSVNNYTFRLKSNEVGFIYRTPVGDKIYLPNNKKGLKFFSSLPFTYVHGLGDIINCKKLIISKSLKDAMDIKKATNLCTIVVQAENPIALGNKTIDFINENVENVYISWDSDPTGVNQCKELTKKTGWGYINPPKKYLPNKDWADVAKFNGLEAITEHFIKKKII